MCRPCSSRAWPGLGGFVARALPLKQARAQLGFQRVEAAQARWCGSRPARALRRPAIRLRPTAMAWRTSSQLRCRMCGSPLIGCCGGGRWWHPGIPGHIFAFLQNLCAHLPVVWKVAIVQTSVLRVDPDVLPANPTPGATMTFFHTPHLSAAHPGRSRERRQPPAGLAGSPGPMVRPATRPPTPHGQLHRLMHRAGGHVRERRHCSDGPFWACAHFRLLCSRSRPVGRPGQRIDPRPLAT